MEITMDTSWPDEQERALRSRLEGEGFTEVAIATAFRESGPVFFVQMVAPEASAKERPGPPDLLAGGKGRRARKLSKKLKRIAETLDSIAAKDTEKHERLFREVLEIREGTLSLAGSLLAKNDELRARLGEKGGGE